MTLDTKTTGEITQKFQLHEKDTGSVDIQIAILSEQIAILSEHLKRSSSEDLLIERLELMRVIGRRRKLLNYLKSTDTKRYKTLVLRLELEK